MIQRSLTEKGDTAAQILDVAQELVQLRGFNAVSYSDISRRLGIRNASVHYHFPAKTDLGVALVRRYRERLETHLAAISARGLPLPERLEAYLLAYREVVHPDGRICLCTVLANDYNTLPPAMQGEVAQFFETNRRWLAAALAEGQESGEMKTLQSPEQSAAALLAGLEGAMLLARASGDTAQFEPLARVLLQQLRAA
ncbi:TetR/AcrR family transcriptional regulator [Deinococcus gobiensis]|uniref:TetR/AcrR family transcriptional regulator n=1 Tax=Deinococcus gobiensis TaxID=502394 RepID=UPI0005C13FEA|nr:TetR/AcrR family transcriptional regulator [Deinococcus gobiensis]